MFIKHGDGKINHIVESEELTEEQKLVIKKSSEKIIEKSESTTQEKKLEN